MTSIQKKLLEIAKEFIKICETHNLRYYASSGTLLGAVRHKGFIPWDDDMDFYMPRSDYNKLIELDKKGCFKDQYIFKHWDKTKNYIWNFGKIEDTQTTCIESTIAEHGVDYKSGIGIDIFILDGGGDKQMSSKIHFDKMTKCASRRYDKYWNQKSNNPLKRLVQSMRRSVFTSQFFMEYFKNKHDELAHKYNFDDSKFIASAFVLCTCDKSYHTYSDFEPSIIMPFEDIYIKCPNNYKAYLERLYGDYMTPPPESERTGHMPYFVDLNLPFEEYDAPYIKKLQ